MIHLNIGKRRSGAYLLAAAGLATLFLFSACSPPAASDEKLTQEIKGLKGEVAQLKEKLGKLETDQQEVIKMLKKLGVAPQPAAAPEPPAPQSAAPAPAAPAEAAGEVLTVGQLLKNKDRFLNTRVTVKGVGGTVVIHHKLLMLKAPEGMVEVFFGSLQDKKTVDRLTVQEFNQPLTVAGLVTLAPKGPGLRITAEKVEF